ncbi:hypothetical protein J2Z42_001546 [Clostridium algifaecis]|uniref:Cytosolic protein n=1 Tax=Clostridium algifaecis TaxID=1472040 RepID=A0ABS4KS63_9CLOT|nr:DUF6282 family protein [Clostridium algifaecis]MBP2032867.1 hypothetical protein [Clostridium algifaecis]
MKCEDNGLEGIIDLHIHTAPDIRERRLNDIELVKEAKRVGARAVVLKSHVVPTMDRAWIAQQLVKGIHVFGGIVLNPQIGGLNIAAVQNAIKMNAKIIWLPTSFAANERKQKGMLDGVEVMNNGQIVPELLEILKLIAQHNVVLATGHLSPYEIRVVVEKAKEIGVKKILINHPEWPTVNMSLDDQRALIKYDVYFERCYAHRVNGKYEKNFSTNLKAIESLGYESTIISTDGGQVENPVWSEELYEYVSFLKNSGLSEEAINNMTKKYPAKMLGLD